MMSGTEAAGRPWACCRCGDEDGKLTTLELGEFSPDFDGLGGRLCEDCRDDLALALELAVFEDSPNAAAKPDPASEEWHRRAVAVALNYSPDIYPCRRCGWPVADGYECPCSGEADTERPAFAG